MTIRNQATKELKAKGPWYNFHNREGENPVRIDIMDVIGGWDGISAKTFSNQLKQIGEDTPLDIHICSDGGSIVEGNEIYNILNAHKGEVTVTLGALCASIATVVAMAGDKIRMAKNGLFMIHDPWTFAMGSADDMRRNADIMDKMKDTIVMAYRSRGEKVPNDAALKKAMTDETWYNADEALASGFIDEIIKEEDEESEEEAKNLLAFFDLSQFKNSARAKAHYAALSKKEDGEPSNKQQKENLPQPAKPAPASEPKNQNQPPKKEKNQMTEEEKQAAAAEAKRLYQARLARDKQINDIVVQIRNRDKKDFGRLAAQFLTPEDERTPQDFAMACANAKEDAYDPFETVIGAGVEVYGNRIAKGTPGQIFIEAPEYKDLVKNMAAGSRRQGGILVNTDGFVNVTTSTGLTSIEKLPGVVQLGVRRLTVKDLIAPGATNATLVRYIRETTFVNAAAITAEDATKPAASFTFDEQDAPVKKIAVYTKITDELFKDYAQVASVINQRLPYMVERTEEDQILNGDGLGNNLTGILNTGGIQTQAKGGDTAVDAAFKAMTKIRFTGFFEPDGYVFNPIDWESIRLMKDLNGQYFGGGPFTGAYGNGPLVQFDTLWGKPVVVTPAIAQGTALCGAFRLGAQYFMKDGLTIETTNTDQDDFIKNRITIRAETRLALAVYRALAFCQITGL